MIIFIFETFEEDIQKFKLLFDNRFIVHFYEKGHFKWVVS